MRHQSAILAPSSDTVHVAIVYRNFASHSTTSHIGLGVSAAHCQRTLRRHGISCDVWACWTAKDIETRLAKAQDHAHRTGGHPVSHVIISAPWVATPDLLHLVTSYDEVNFAVVSHSNFGFLSADPGAIQLLRQGAAAGAGTHNLHMAGNCRKFTDSWEQMYGAPMVLLPNLYDVHGFRHAPERWHPGQCLRIGIFGAARPLKNMITSVASAVALGRELGVQVEISVNNGRDDGGPGASTADNAIKQLVQGLPTVRLIQAGWLGWSEFRDLAGSMHLLFQLSYTESFNLVTADGISVGVPSVVGEAIDWVPDRWQANVDDVRDVVRVARGLLHDPHAARAGQRALHDYVTHGIQEWKNYLGI